MHTDLPNDFEPSDPRLEAQGSVFLGSGLAAAQRPGMTGIEASSHTRWPGQTPATDEVKNKSLGAGLIQRAADDLAGEGVGQPAAVE
jgi:hypothetical protein